MLLSYKSVGMSGLEQFIICISTEKKYRSMFFDQRTFSYLKHVYEKRYHYIVNYKLHIYSLFKKRIIVILRLFNGLQDDGIEKLTS